MAVKITMTSIGVDILEPLQVYTGNTINNWVFYDTATKVELISGFEISQSGLYYKVVGTITGGYGTIEKIFSECAGVTTTTTTTAAPTTTTTTAAPGTTTTTTSTTLPPTTTSTTLPPTTTSTTLPPTTTTTTTSGCVQISSSLVYNSSSESLACSGSGSVYYGDNSNFISTTIIATNASCTLAPAGYYSDGFNYRQWNGSSFIGSGNCQDFPTVTTYAAANITGFEVQLGGESSSISLEDTTEVGVCWSTTNSNNRPLYTDNKMIMGNSDGTFNNTVSGLTPNTTYYVRAYAVNALGIGYGSVESFTTLNTYANTTSVYSCPGTCADSPIDTGYVIETTNDLTVGYWYNDGTNVYEVTSSGGIPSTFVSSIGEFTNCTDAFAACPS